MCHREIVAGACVKDTPYRSPLLRTGHKAGSHVQFKVDRALACKWGSHSYGIAYGWP